MTPKKRYSPLRGSVDEADRDRVRKDAEEAAAQERADYALDGLCDSGRPGEDDLEVEEDDSDVDEDGGLGFGDENDGDGADAGD